MEVDHLPRTGSDHLPIPGMICWRLWKRRNKVNYGGTMTWRRVIYEISRNTHLLTLILYPWMKNIPQECPLLMDFLQKYKSVIRSVHVSWKLPNQGWFKCNSDGASKGNLGPSSITFCIRNDEGDTQYALCRRMADSTSLFDEATTLKEDKRAD
ncbi:hypothetical protein KY285_033328 [Solanum tuberosum]|nr:hypothetical protein KY285_033328 [Solanum tuberosum]